jgi:hypothetical protein
MLVFFQGGNSVVRVLGISAPEKIIKWKNKGVKRSEGHYSTPRKKINGRKKEM